MADQMTNPYPVTDPRWAAWNQDRNAANSLMEREQDAPLTLKPFHRYRVAINYNDREPDEAHAITVLQAHNFASIEFERGELTGVWMGVETPASVFGDRIRIAE